MDWRNYIVSDREVLLGKPIVKGTRISVEHVLDLFAQGWSDQQILQNYPTLNRDALIAIFLYLREGIHDGLLYSLTEEKR